MDLDEQVDFLVDDELSIDSMVAHRDEEIIHMTNPIQQLLSKKIEVAPEIDLSKLVVLLYLRERDLEKLAASLMQLSDVRVEDFKSEEHSMILRNAFDIEKRWICHGCEEVNPQTSNECLQCKVFKPLSLYPSFYRNAHALTEKELKDLEERREKEKQLISNKDSVTPPENIDTWYIVDSEWLKDWKMFVSNRKSSTQVAAPRMSLKPGVGILDPGPISNSRLVSKQKNNDFAPTEGLERGRDYRGVNEEVWNALHQIYGGGPVIRRYKLDVYSDEPVLFEEPKRVDSIPQKPPLRQK